MTVPSIFGSAPVVAASPSPSPAAIAFRLQDPTINESSGLAVSRRHRSTVWTHNDGGAAARVHALDRSGRTRAVVTLRGVDPFDPEALAPGKGPRGEPVLFLGDIGDNGVARRDVSIFRFGEPARLVDQAVTADWFRLRYPDGPHDAEALLVDPRDGRLWIASKDLFGGGLYRAPAQMSTQRTNVLERVADVPGLVTDGAFLPDGRFVLRSYATAYVFRAPGRTEAAVALPPQEQGESLAVDGDTLLVGSEGRGSAVYAVPVPRVAPHPASPASSASVPSDRPSDGSADAAPSSNPADEPGRLGIVAAGVGTLLLMLVVVIVRRLRRGRGELR
jgi:hypothetical protein